MKTFNILVTGILVVLLAISCAGDKKSELAKLRKQHEAIASKIEKLEQELAAGDTVKSAAMAKVVAVKHVEYQPFNHYIEVQGRLDGDESVSVSPKIASTVTALYVNIGDHVHKGQVLAKLDEKPTGQNLEILRNNLELATELYNKQKRLYDQKIGSEVAYLNAKNAKETLEQSIATVVDLSTIKSPINGAVEEVNTKIGQLVAPQVPVFRVVSFKRLKVLADISESYSTKINKGDVVTIYLPDAEAEMKATITACSKFINPVNRTFAVEAAIYPSGYPLKANMIAILKINDYKNLKSINVPVNVIQNDQTGKYIVVAENNGNDTIARRKPVDIGMMYNGIAEVTHGLIPGDKIITTGFQDLDEGDLIRY